MKLAVSNIAWDPSENEEIITILREHQVQGIELAPTKRWPDPDLATDEETKQYKNYWLSKQLTPVAMQSLLFNRSHLSLFGEAKSDTIAYLTSIIRLAGKLSTKALVFGSPKNRLIGDHPYNLRYAEAVDIFRILGDQAVQNGVYFCIEPNPREYGCDFVTTTFEGLQFIKDVNHPGIRLHLDTGTMLVNREEPGKVLEECIPYVAHFHISDPFLLIPGSQEYRHDLIGEALSEFAYSGWVSLEMKNGNLSDDKEALRQALSYVRTIYKGI